MNKKMTVYERNYKKIKPLLADYRRIEVQGFMPLVIERIGDEVDLWLGDLTPILAEVMRYYKQEDVYVYIVEIKNAENVDAGFKAPSTPSGLVDVGTEMWSEY